MNPVPVSPRVPDPLAARCRRLEETIHALQATRAQLAAAASGLPTRLQAVERDLARAEEEWQEVRAEVLLRDPRYSAFLSGSAPPDVQEIARTVRRDEALLEYSLGPQRSLCFVVRNGTVQVRPLGVGRDRLAAEIDSLLGPLQSPLSLGTLTFDRGLAVRLREQLVDPVLPLLEGVRRLVIVPDGPLCRLPFETLILDAGGGDSGGGLYGGFARARFLDDRFAVTYLPAASLRREGAPRRASPGMSLLAMGDPAGGAVTPGSADTPGGAGPAAVPASESLSASEGRLAHSADEVRAIGALFPGATVRLGVDASEQSLKSLAPQYRYLHLAAHGRADELVPLYSGISLAPDPGGEEDGFLHAYEVLAIPLQSDLVTLSACRTGRGRVYAGEGLLGLTRAFLQAGAGQVLVSLWSVDDASTAVLMKRFYASLQAGLDAPQALREAKSAMRQAVLPGAGGTAISCAHPFFWAPFILVSSGSDPQREATSAAAPG